VCQVFGHEKKGNYTQKDIQGNFGGRSPRGSMRGTIVVMGHINLPDNEFWMKGFWILDFMPVPCDRTFTGLIA
jgi:hypothetical protein